MGDRRYASMVIGAVEEHLREGLLQAIAKDYALDQEYDELPESWDQFSGQIYDNEASSGCFDETESFCQENGIEFDRYTESFGSDTAYTVMFRKGMTETLYYDCDGSGNPLIPAASLAAIRTMLMAGEVDKALAEANRLLVEFDISAVQPLGVDENAAVS